MRSYDRIEAMMREDGFDPPTRGMGWNEAANILADYIAKLRGEIDRLKDWNDELTERVDRP